MNTVKEKERDLLDTSKVKFSDLLTQSDVMQEKCSDFSLEKVNPENFRFNEMAGITYQTNSGEIRRPSISRFALSQLCGKIGVPAQYIDKCVSSGRIDLAQDNVNSWLEDYNKNLFIREYDGRIRGILSDRYSVCDTPDILYGISDVLPVDNYNIKGFFLNEEFLHIRMVDRHVLPINNEDLYPGISIDTSDVGKSNLTVNFFIWKKVCTNGLVIPKKFGILFRQKHIGIDSDEFRTTLQESIKMIQPITDNVVKAINDTATISLESAFEDKDSLENLIARVRQQTKLSEESTNKVIQLIQNETYPMNRWGLINSITEVAQDFSIFRRLELERIAGEMLVA